MSTENQEASAKLKKMEMLSKASDVECKQCGGRLFKEVVMFKYLSALVSDTGKEAVIPIPTYRCDDCGAMHDLFMPKI